MSGSANFFTSSVDRPGMDLLSETTASGGTRVDESGGGDVGVGIFLDGAEAMVDEEIRRL